MHTTQSAHLLSGCPDLHVVLRAKDVTATECRGACGGITMLSGRSGRPERWVQAWRKRKRLTSNLNQPNGALQLFPAWPPAARSWLSEVQWAGDGGHGLPLCPLGSAFSVIPPGSPVAVNLSASCCLKYHYEEKVLPRKLVVGYRKAFNCYLPAIM